MSKENEQKIEEEVKIIENTLLFLSKITDIPVDEISEKIFK